MILPFIPYPLRDNGGTIRYLPVIEYLSNRFCIDMIVIDNGQVDQEKIDAVRKYCRDLTVVRNPKIGKFSFFRKASVAIRSLMPWSASFDYVTYGGDMLVREILSASKGRNYDCLIWVAGYYAEYLFEIMRNMHADQDSDRLY